MKMKGLSNQDIKKVTYQNAIDAFGQSGQIYLQDFQKTNKADQSITYNGNSVLRGGQQPQNTRESVFIK